MSYIGSPMTRIFNPSKSSFTRHQSDTVLSRVPSRRFHNSSWLYALHPMRGLSGYVEPGARQSTHLRLPLYLNHKLPGGYKEALSLVIVVVEARGNGTLVD